MTLPYIILTISLGLILLGYLFIQAVRAVEEIWEALSENANDQ